MTVRRALILVRLSRMTDATTSPERQEADARRYCEAHGMDVVGVASDLDVSGSVDPLDRPELGGWLRSRLQEWDVIVASKLDRVGRNARHIHALMSYLLDAGKSLKTVADSIDIGTAIGRMIVYVMATVAEMELDEISARNTNAAQYNLRAGKYRGGLPPAGYRGEKDDAGDWRLVPDEEGSAPVLRDIVQRVINGERLAGITKDLNDRGVPTHKDRQAEINGRERTPSRWSVSNVRRLIASPTLIGHVVYREPVMDENGKPVKVSGEKQYGPEQVLFADGEPVVRAEPLISSSDFYTMRDILNERRENSPKQQRSAASTLLVQVIFCAVCGGPMYKLKGAKGRVDRYRCNSVAQGAKCANGTVTIAEADGWAAEAISSLLDNIPHVSREYVVGSDHGETLTQIDGELASLAESITRFPAGSPALTALLSKVDQLSAKREELAALPVTASGWRYVPTGDTFGEWWAELDTTARNDFLREHGLRITAHRELKTETVYKLETGDIMGMIESIYPGQIAEIRERVANTPGAADMLDVDDPAVMLSLIDRQAIES